MSAHRRGITLIELLVVVAVTGVLLGIGFVLLPRGGFAVNQAERIFASAIQYGRFEAIKRNVTIDVVFAEAATEVLIQDTAGTVLRRFSLDPQGERVVVKAVDQASMRFNSRGVAVSPVLRSVTIGIRGLDTFDRTLTVSGQGSVGRASS